MSDPKLDIVVCSHNEAAYLPGVLDSLRRQAGGTGDFRVIVVDNASSDGTPDVVQQNQAGLNLEYRYGGHLGLNHARNAGIAAGTGEHVAFLDADALAHKEWTATIYDTVRQTRADLYGGPYYPFYVTDKPAWYMDRYNSVTLGQAARFLEATEFLNGTNMIWRRDVLEPLGSFHTQIGLTGRGYVRGDETELIIRARRERPAFLAFYNPAIIVYHTTRPETYKLSYWLRRHFWQGWAARATFGPRSDLPTNRLRLVWRLLHVTAHLTKCLVSGAVKRDRRQYPYYANYLYEVALPQLWSLGELTSYIGAGRLSTNPAP